MDWWQYLIVSVVSVLLDTFIGYKLTRCVAEQERKQREKEKINSAIHGILVET